MVNAAFSPLQVYYCSHPEDLAFCRALDTHLAPLKGTGRIQTWGDQQILAGQESHREKEVHLTTAQILLLLISPDFLASETNQHQIDVALHRLKERDVVAIPIWVRPCNWRETELVTLEFLPREQKAISTWLNHDEAWQSVVVEISRVVESIRQWAFVIAAPEDHDIVERLQQDLANSGIEFWTSDHENMLQDFSQDIEIHRGAMRNASVVILIASPHASRSRIVNAQIDLAADYQRLVVVVWAKGDDWGMSNPGNWPIGEIIDVRAEQYMTAREVLRKRIRPNALFGSFSMERSQVHTKPRNPYKGLYTFTEEDRHDFFGRETLIQEMATTIENILTQDKKGKRYIRLMAVVGASGSGKSSAVKAGLLPCLKKGESYDSQKWIYLDPIVPGLSPLKALAGSFAKRLPLGDADTISHTLTSDSLHSLHSLACQLVHSSGQKVVLFIDQFEEVFNLNVSETERQHFFDLLITAVSEPQGPLLIILTLRADFYDRPMQYPAFYRLLDAHRISVLPMKREELLRVIEQPARLPDVQITFEDNLVGDLLFDMREQVGALPLLQFTLDQLFKRRSGHQLTLRAYREIGEIKGALTKHADSTYAALPSDAHRKSAHDVFLRLIDPGLTEQDTTRRRAPFAEFERSDPTQEMILHETIEAFIAARLLISDKVADATMLEVSHEALIREWPRLAAWLHETREDIFLQQAISRDAAEWQQRQNPKDLYSGAQLTEARTWAKNSKPSTQETAFLRAGARRQVQSTVRLIVIVFFLVATTGFASWFLFHSQSTVKNINDSGPGSLRQAIVNADPGSVITFDPALKGTITLTTGDLEVSKNLIIQGPGAQVLAVSGNNHFRVFRVTNPINVDISGLAIIHGMVSDSGGGIINFGNLNLTNVLISMNAARGGAGGISSEGAGQLTLINSILSKNTSVYGDGGITNGNGSLNIYSSTIAYNTGNVTGGIDSGISLTMTNSTVTENTATGAAGAGGIFIGGGGEAIISYSTIYKNTGGLGGNVHTNNFITKSVRVERSIIAGGRAPYGPDVYGTIVSFSGGYNLIQNVHDMYTQVIFDPDLANSHNLFGVLPEVGLLQDNGGPTPTLALLSKSPAISYIPSAACGDVSNDQRGKARPQGDGCDIGAYETDLTASRFTSTFVKNKATKSRYRREMLEIPDITLDVSLRRTTYHRSPKDIVVSGYKDCSKSAF